MHRSRKGNLASVILILIILTALGAGAYTLFQDMDSPEVVLSPQTGRTSPKQEFTLTASDKTSGIRSINVSARKNDRTYTILDKVFDKPQHSETVTFTLADTGIKEGSLELEVKVADSSNAGFGKGNKITRAFPMVVDTTPPRFDVKTMPPYIRRGGTGCVLYGMNKEVVKTGVKVGDLFFPGFKQPNGEYLAFFAFPYYMAPNEYSPSLVAEDIAGNTGSIPLAVNRINREFKRDVLDISDNFLANKMPEFEEQVPGQMSGVERFIKVNNDLRKSNQEKLKEVGQKSSPKIMWQGAFQRLPNAAPRAGFADHRTYMYNKQKIDEQFHLGHDLASLAQAPIPAGNDGIVVFTDNLGIYGNLVIIDHGCGLQSLYSHMTDISVAVGQEVKRGDTIGRTGKTGMAAGDHLHFGFTVSGIEVIPTEWLDSHWIKDNVVDRIVSAGGTMPAMIDNQPEEPAAPRQQILPASGSQKKGAPAKPAPAKVAPAKVAPAKAAPGKATPAKPVQSKPAPAKPAANNKQPNR